MKNNHVNRSPRKLLIYPRFQVTLLTLNMTIILVGFILIGYQNIRLFSHLKEMGTASNLPPDHAYFKFIDYQTHTMLTYAAVIFAVVIVLSTLASLWLSHKVAGPIVRMKGFFKSLAESESPQASELKFRKGDFFSDLPELVNEALKNKR
jgi:hypothetical protein